LFKNGVGSIKRIIDQSNCSKYILWLYGNSTMKPIYTIIMNNFINIIAQLIYTNKNFLIIVKNMLYV
jgi:hypothetical protein